MRPSFRPSPFAIIMLSAAALTPVAATAQTGTAQLPADALSAAQGGADFAAVDRYVEEQRQAAHLPGIALGIIQGDRVVHVRASVRRTPPGDRSARTRPSSLGPQPSPSRR